MTKIIRAITFICLAIWASLAHSKVIYEPYANSQEVTIRIENEIAPQDLLDFKSALKQLDESKKTLHMNSVELNSIGGKGGVAEDIGAIIRSRKLNTYLAADSRCYSACVSVLISGVQRYAFGRIGVHRSTFSDETIPEKDVEKFFRYAKKSNEDYLMSMRVSLLLADAMQSAESWSMRELTELEKSQWRVFGFDRPTEEVLFNQIAKKRHFSRHEFIDIFVSNYEDCLKEARDFKQTVFDCAKSKNLKPLSYYRQFRNWLAKKTVSSNGSNAQKLPHPERVEIIRTMISDGELYKRYTTITEVNDLKPNNTQFQSLDAPSVSKLEASNEWWVEDNILSVLVSNPIDSSLKEFVFELSPDCTTKAGKKRLLSLLLLVNLEARGSAVYSGQIPFEYIKAFGEGIRCGLIKAAYQ